MPQPSYRYGVANPEDAAGLTGRQFLQAIIDGKLPAPPISQTLSFWLVEVGDGAAVFEGEPGAQLRHPFGLVHGGWAMTLIDSATTCAAHSLLPPGAGSTTVETKVNFVRPITPDSGRVRAQAKVVSRGRRIITSEARLTDGKGRVLAHGTSTVIVLDAQKGEAGSPGGQPAAAMPPEKT